MFFGIASAFIADRTNMPKQNLKVDGKPDNNYAKTKGDNGRLPLHNELRKVNPVLEEIDRLIHAFPKALEVRCEEGLLPIHHALDNKYLDFSAIRTLVKAYPRGLLKPISGLDQYPAHQLCNVDNRANRGKYEDELRWKCMLKIYKAEPEILSKANMNGNLPIHYCAASNMRMTLKFLAEKSPLSLGHRNNKGELPIHKCWTCEGFFFLAKMSPTGLFERDHKGQLPLNRLITRDPCGDDLLPLLKDLLAIFPNLTRLEDEKGNLPLHYAVRKSRLAPVVKLLVAQYPEACLHKNKAGDLPIHLSCDSMFRMMAKKEPRSMAIKNNRKDYPLTSFLRKTGLNDDQLDTVTRGLDCHFPFFVRLIKEKEELEEEVKRLRAAAPDVDHVPSQQDSPRHARASRAQYAPPRPKKRAKVSLPSST